MWKEAPARLHAAPAEPALPFSFKARLPKPLTEALGQNEGKRVFGLSSPNGKRTACLLKPCAVQPIIDRTIPCSKTSHKLTPFQGCPAHMLTLFLTSLHPLTLPLQGQSGPLKRGETHTLFLEDLRAHFVSWCSSGARSPYCFCDCHKGFRSIAPSQGWVSILCLLCQMHQYMVLLRQAVHVLTCIHCSPSQKGIVGQQGVGGCQKLLPCFAHHFFQLCSPIKV